MSESLREKSNKRILVLANNDVGLYRFRKDLLAALLGAGHKEYISYPDGRFDSEQEQLDSRIIHTTKNPTQKNPKKTNTQNVYNKRVNKKQKEKERGKQNENGN